MSWLSGAAAIACLALTACSAEDKVPPQDIKTVSVTVSLPEDAVIDAPAIDLSKQALETVARLRGLTQSGRLTPIIREAERSENFQSNFGDQSHSQHWFLLRRVGVDPVENLRRTLEQPFGVKRVGTENWFIWPDFAARAPDELVPESLSFLDRARLRELIGEQGIARIRAGEPYPGVRLAISETGRWVYFIHDIEATEDDENDQ